MSENTATEIVRTLCEHGCEAYITGGAVRDEFLGETPNDYDVVTNATPDILKNIFHNRKLQLVGVSFKVVIVDGIEVATYRNDRYHGLSAKNAEISIAKTIQEDLARRDLTINAFAACPYTGEIVDPFGGIKDLKDKIVKFVGNPADRIHEDPCRILRACRFLAKLEGQFDAQTFIALRNHSEYIEKYVAPERIRLEILKTMKYPKASLFFESLLSIGALKHIFPSLQFTLTQEGGPYHNETVWEHSMDCGDEISTRYPLLKLAGYLHDVGKPITAFIGDDGEYHFKGHEKAGSDVLIPELEKLRFSKEEIHFITTHVEQHMTNLIRNDPTQKTIRRFLKRMKDKKIDYRDHLILNLADRKSNRRKEPHPIWKIKRALKKISKEINRPLNVTDLDINGNDLTSLGLNPGPEIGKLLRSLLERVLEDPDLNNKKSLLEIAKSEIQTKGSG